MLSVAVPDAEDFVAEGSGAGVSVGKGMDDGFHALWVKDRGDAVFVIPD